MGLDPVEALKNLKRMAKMDWMGAYGFYEAADYQESIKTPKLVLEWMAHHQGMSLLAILNLLYDNIVQDWFHANAHLEATQLLLHEKPMHEAALRAEFQAAQPPEEGQLGDDVGENPTNARGVLQGRPKFSAVPKLF